MSKPTNTEYNKRMLQLMRESIHTGKAENEGDWCKKIGFNNYNLPKVKAGNHSFQIKQIIAAAKLSKVSVDWICGITTIREPNNKEYTAIQMIEEGLRMLKK